jgi:hypothetical protein
MANAICLHKLGAGRREGLSTTARDKGRRYCDRSERAPALAAFGDKKEGASGKKAPSGFEVLLQKAFEGGKKASSSGGLASLLQSLGDGVVERNFGTGGSWPDAALAKRRGECPRCGASTAEALAGARGTGSRMDPIDGPVELATVGQHPLGWCKECAVKDRLWDVSKSF